MLFNRDGLTTTVNSSILILRKEDVTILWIDTEIISLVFYFFLNNLSQLNLYIFWFLSQIADLSADFEQLRSLKSYEILPNSWFSVAWYPIYRIPTGPTLRDLAACFLTFHSLSTSLPAGGINISAVYFCLANLFPLFLLLQVIFFLYSKLW